MREERGRPRRRRPGAALSAPAAVAALSLAATACGQSGGADGGAEEAADTAAKVDGALAATYDGGVYVIDGTTLEVVEDVPLDGFNRLNPAGDGRHVLVSTSSGFRVLDAAGAELTGAVFEASEPGHVVRHAGKTVLFADGTGEVTVFDPGELGEGLPEAETSTTEHPHHGVAVALEDGGLATTMGNEEERTGVRILGAGGEETARNGKCPGVHGEATARGGALLFGCEDGALVYSDGGFAKIGVPDDYGRIGNQAGHKDSRYVLGDYKTDPETELERPERVSILDTAEHTLELVDLGTSYSFRSLGRGPDGEALVLGTDGAIHVIDPASAEVTDSFPVLGEWREPLEWQEPRPTLFVRGGTAYVTDPGEKRLYAVDLGSGKVRKEAALPEAANELTGI
ncbi:zinc metallochaperone AztD [Streptomonospora wellingtoniae]|uniref:Zinc metallochaperone AztD n=1 Tax=Streptomonospora wellingtoniae TaxID=3075544 RepID=A0ABU2KW12_9ACTN|nr:zinc metallochaperone AztD [Streptomonospora sp. DSM 45055]MDT0303486.1 zinc metallochaperone AztD [Streptomonospora sp. DSM 45055]